MKNTKFRIVSYKKNGGEIGIRAHVQDTETKKISELFIETDYKESVVYFENNDCEFLTLEVVKFRQWGDEPVDKESVSNCFIYGTMEQIEKFMFSIGYSTSEKVVDFQSNYQKEQFADAVRNLDWLLDDLKKLKKETA